jgi:predicted DNA-binding protein (MmcQ/YjbR family)
MWPLDKVRVLCLSLPETSEDLPFGPGTHVFRVAGKMFALCDPGVRSINLKADPDEIPLLREQYPAVQPGYHQDKIG